MLTVILCILGGIAIGAVIMFLCVIAAISEFFNHIHKNGL